MSISLSSPSSPDKTAFAYKPLSTEADTRLIELEPAPDASFPLQCRISEICLSSDDLIEYEALSYTWGAPELTETLHVTEDEDKTSFVKITTNLRGALQRVRLNDRKRLLWVDAVCINQQDDSDKSKQIPTMAQIFSAASRVLVWLGTSLEGQRSLIDIKKAQRFHHRDSQRIEAHLSNLETSFNDLVALPWFSRRWIIQEVVLAADVIIMCGPEEIPLIHLFRVMNGLSGKNEFPSALAPLAAISKLWKTWVFEPDRESGLRLLELLSLFEKSDCQIGLDRIYALCNLASDCVVVDQRREVQTNKISVVVDYNQTAECLFQSIVEHVLSFGTTSQGITGRITGHYVHQDVDKSREVLDAIVERCDGSSRKTKAWVPDWRLPKRREAIHKSLNDNWRIDPEHSLDVELLKSEIGIQPESSSKVIQVVLEPFPEHPNMADVKNWLQTMRDRFADCQPQFPGNQFASPESKGAWRFLKDDLLLSDNEMPTDCNWCAFLSMALEQGNWWEIEFDLRISIKTREENARNLYLLSLGKSGVQASSSSECWSFLCRLFNARRIFFYRRNNDPHDTLYGVGIGPDHLKAGTGIEFSLPENARGRIVPIAHETLLWQGHETLLWHIVPEQAPALLGDGWVYNIGQGL